ncbi:hypothetical protein B0H19DRAFT_1075988 [Mycena capillaripes]|nr:hypothetical protein B0H19DRAFT_1075988 [Mycena capillaripes]
MPSLRSGSFAVLQFIKYRGGMRMGLYPVPVAGMAIVSTGVQRARPVTQRSVVTMQLRTATMQHYEALCSLTLPLWSTMQGSSPHIMAFRQLGCFLASTQPCNNKNEISILTLAKKQEYLTLTKVSGGRSDVDVPSWKKGTGPPMIMTGTSSMIGGRTSTYTYLLLRAGVPGYGRMVQARVEHRCVSVDILELRERGGPRDTPACDHPVEGSFASTNLKDEGISPTRERCDRVVVGWNHQLVKVKEVKSKLWTKNSGSPCPHAALKKHLANFFNPHETTRVFCASRLQPYQNLCTLTQNVARPENAHPKLYGTQVQFVRPPSCQTNKETNPSNVVEVSFGSTPLKHASTYSTSSGHLCIAAVHLSCSSSLVPRQSDDRIFARASSGTFMNAYGPCCPDAIFVLPVMQRGDMSSTFESGFIADTDINLFLHPKVSKSFPMHPLCLTFKFSVFYDSELAGLSQTRSKHDTTKLDDIEALSEESYKKVRTLVHFFFLLRCNSSPLNALRSCDNGRGHATPED